METGVAGFKIQGSWEQIVEHGEQISQALAAVGFDQAELTGDLAAMHAEWEAWRPKRHEALDEEINEKTAEQASLPTSEAERAGTAPADEVASAGERLSEAFGRLNDARLDEAMGELRASVGHALRAAGSASRKALRSAEEAVYRGVMTRISPYYFDNPLISAHIQRLPDEEGEERYLLEVNINDDTLKDAVAAYLAGPLFEDDDG